MGCLLTHLSYSILLNAKVNSNSEEHCNCIFICILMSFSLILQFSLTLLFLETPTLNYPQLYPTGQLLRFILISSPAL